MRMTMGLGMPTGSVLVGEPVGSDVLPKTGNGPSQPWATLGRIPSQTTPAPGSYLDTVTVTTIY